MGDEDDRAFEGRERVLERLAALDVEVVGRLVEDQHVGAGGDQDRQREAPLLAAGDVVERLLHVGSGEEEAAEQVARLLAAEPGLALGGVEHGARPRRRLGVLGEVADLDVVPGAHRAGGRLALLGEGLDQGRLAGAVGADEDDVLAAFELRGWRRRAACGPAPRSSPLTSFSTTRPGPLRFDEGEAQVAAIARFGLDAVALDLVDLLEPRLRLFGLGRLVAEALDEALHPLDLRLLALDRLAAGDLARRLLLAPGVPGAGEEAAALGLQLEHRGADRLEEPAVVGDEDDGGVEVDEVALEPFQRGNVEVVRRLVEQQQVGAGGEGTGQRGPGQLAAGEGRELSRGRLLAEAEAAEHGEDVVAPAVAAARFEPLLRRRVGPHRLLVGGAGAHRRLQARQLGLGLLHVGAAGEDVVAERDRVVARRALVVQGHPRAFLQGDAARVGRPLAGEDAQQRRLADAVAPGERHPLARLELEGDVGEEQLAAGVEVDRGRCGDGHGQPDITRPAHQPA